MYVVCSSKPGLEMVAFTCFLRTNSDSEAAEIPPATSDSGTVSCTVAKSATATITTQLTQLSLDNQTTPQPPQPSCYHGPCFPPSYLNVIEEPSEDESLAYEVKELLRKYRQESSEEVVEVDQVGPPRQRKGRRERKRNDQRQKSAVPGGEGYERSFAKHGDKVFQKFHKQLTKCPQQVLRWFQIPS